MLWTNTQSTIDGHFLPFPTQQGPDYSHDSHDKGACALGTIASKSRDQTSSFTYSGNPEVELIRLII